MNRIATQPLSVCLFLLALAALLAATPLAASEDPPGEDWLAEAQAKIQTEEYHFSPDRQGRWSAPNRAHDLRTRVDESGFSVVSRTEGEGKFHLGMRLVGFGRTGGGAPVERALLNPADGRVELRRFGLTEWLINDDRGLKHGFDVDSPPRGRGDVVLRLALDGSLQAYPIGHDGRGVVLKDAGGDALLRYDGLAVIDASGAEIPSWIEIAVGELRIVFDDSDALYPVIVDPILTNAAWSVTGALYLGLGVAVSTAGDVNGDGYSDVIIGSPGFDGGDTDEGLISVYHGGPGGLSGSAVWSFQPNRRGARLGEAVSTAGDVNGDGYHDIIAGAPMLSFGQLEEGRAYVFLGSSTGLDSTPHWETESNEAFAHYGASVSFAGDVNNDGFHDVLVGAPLLDAAATDGGQIFLFFGSSSGLSTTADWTQSSAHAGAHFGASVSGAGDLDGDGYGDIVAGAPMYDWPDVDEGRVFFYRGTSTTPVYEGGYTRTGSLDAGIHFGQSVAGAGDLNGDGYADVIAGAPDDWSTSGGSASLPGGSFTIFWGTSSGISALGPTLGLGTQHARTGASVATAGDVNGDGLADIVVGSPVLERATVYCGKKTGNPVNCGTLSFGQNGSEYGATVSTAGDVNNDGFSDVIVGAPNYTINSFLYGRVFAYHGGPDGLVTSPESEFGASLGRLGSAVASADVNGDGFSDLIVGEPEHDGGGNDAGRISIYHGSRNGYAATPYHLAGNIADAKFGSAVANAGDVNGDGYEDVVVGVPFYSVGQANQGRAYVYLGSSTGLGLLAPGNLIGTQAQGFYGYAVASAGDVNNDGFGDVAVGAYGYDGGQTDEGRVYVYPGSSSGPDLGAVWVLEPDVGGAEFGRAITAGDVDGDGDSDLIVGAPHDSSDVADGGRVYVYRGAVNGLAATATWIVSGDTGGEQFGWSVGSGDIDGDGFTDLAVGAPGYANGQSAEGRFHLFRGQAGAAPTPMGVRESNIPDARLGYVVSVVGDVNGDAFADVITGAPGTTVGGSGNGFARGWYGGPSGIPATPSWEVTSGVFGSQGLFGTSVSGAGDVNGDGFAEVMVGAPNASAQANDAQGGFALYLGGGGHGMDRIPRQQQPYGTGDPPVALLGKSPDNDSIRLRSRARTAAGRDRVQVEYELKPLGQPLDGSSTSFSNQMLLTSSPGSDGSRVNYSTRIYGLTESPNYHWRLRFLSTNPRFPHTRWLWPASIVPSQKGFRTNCNLVVWHRDLDGDGYGTSDDTIDQCVQPSGYVAVGGDCDEANPSINPGAAEIACDAIDNDCSPASADAPDDDGDGFDICLPTDPGDADGLLPDCDDGTGSIYPGAPEINNGLDDQCPGDAGYGIADEMQGNIGFSDPGDPTLLCWDPQPGATAYEVIRSTDPTFAGCGMYHLVVETCINDTPPAGGETYYYLVRPGGPNLGSWGLDSDGVERVDLCF